MKISRGTPLLPLAAALAAAVCLTGLLLGSSFIAAAESLPAPQWIGLFDMKGKVGAKWIHDSRYASVKVYRRSKSRGPAFELVGESRESHYIDSKASSGVTYIYYLVGVGADGAESPPSVNRSLRISFSLELGLAPPAWEGFLLTESGVGLKWKGIAAGEVLAYNIYRKGPAEGDFVLIGSSRGTSYHDRTVEPGGVYAYTLTALDKAFTESPFSEELPVKVPEKAAAPGRIETTWSLRRTRLVKMVAGGDRPFFRPADVVVGPKSGQVYVSDEGNGRIQVFTAGGDFLRTIGGGEGPPIFREVLGLAVDGSENLYGVDPAGNAVVVMSPVGAPLRNIDLTQYVEERVMGLIDAAVAGDGRIFVVDNFNNRVFIFGAGGLVGSFGGPGYGGGQFSAPTFTTLDGSGFLYVSDALNGRVQVFDPGGEFVRSFGRPRQGPGGMGRPKGLAVSGNGEIYVADSWQNVIQVYDGEGVVRAFLADEKGELLDLGSPNGIALGEGKKIYIVERLSNRLQIREIIDED